MTPNKPRGNEPRINQEIQTASIRLINANGDMMGVVNVNEAIRMAEAQGLDLVEISPTANPPVCKILDYGKYKYEAQKKAHDARKKQKVISIKEIKLRPTIDTHDLEVKMRAVRGFLEDGDKVKFTLRFRGREMAHQELGRKLLDKVQLEIEEIAKIEMHPRMEGKQLMMIVVPK